MIDVLLSLLQQNASGKNLAVLWGLAIVFVIALKFRNRKLSRNFKNPELKPFGSRFRYSLQYAKEILDSLGPSGRKFYAISEAALDLPFPVVYSLLFALTILALAPRDTGFSWLHYLSLFPFAAAIIDFMETLCIELLIATFPNLNTTTVRMLQICTFLKWGFVLISLLSVLLAAALVAL